VDGTFGFSDKVTYVSKGPGSWKHEALGTEAAEGDVPYKFNADGSLHLHLSGACFDAKRQCWRQKRPAQTGRLLRLLLLSWTKMSARHGCFAKQTGAARLPATSFVEAEGRHVRQTWLCTRARIQADGGAVRRLGRPSEVRRRGRRTCLSSPAARNRSPSSRHSAPA
jgi:hypothetical protein